MWKCSPSFTKEVSFIFSVEVTKKLSVIKIFESLKWKWIWLKFQFLYKFKAGNCQARIWIWNTQRFMKCSVNLNVSSNLTLDWSLNLLSTPISVNSSVLTSAEYVHKHWVLKLGKNIYNTEQQNAQLTNQWTMLYTYACFLMTFFSCNLLHLTV